MNQKLHINTESLAHNEKIIIREHLDGRVEISKEHKFMIGGNSHENSSFFFLALLALGLFLAFAFSQTDEQPEPQQVLSSNTISDLK